MSKNAVIIAPDEKGLQKVFGIPNARRLVLLLSKLGFENILLLGRTKSLSPVLSDVMPHRAFHSVENPTKLDEALQEFPVLRQGRTLVLKANIVIDKLSLVRFLEADQELPVSHMGLAQGENLDGIYLVDAAGLPRVLELLWSPQRSNSVDLSETAYFRGQDGLPVLVGQQPDDATACEEKLIAALAAQTAKTDGFMSRHFDRRISQFFSRRLVRTKMTPNQVTLTGMSIGLIGALFLSLPGYWSHLFGSLLFVFCIIVDGVDGEVARLKVMDSRFGRYLDISTDNLVHIAIFTGIAIGLHKSTGSELYLWALWLLLGGFAICALAVYKCILSVDAETLRRSPKILKLMKMVSNRDFAYLIALLALFDRLNWFLIGASIGTYIFAASLWTLSYRAQRRSSSIQV